MSEIPLRPAPLPDLTNAGGAARRLAIPAWLQTLLAVTAVTWAAVAPAWSTLPKFFIGDDMGLVQQFSDRPWWYVLTLFTAPWQTAYGTVPDELRPMVALSYQFDSIWGATNPLGYHVTNVVLHAACALLVFAVARWVGRLPIAAAGAAGVLFGVMTVHHEVVGWISGRADSIPTLFFLATILCYALWREGRGGAWLALGMGSFFLGLWSKQSAIVVPVLLVALEVLVIQPRRQGLDAAARDWLARGRNLALAVLPFVGLTVLYLAVRQVLFSSMVRESALTQAALQEFAVLRQFGYVSALFQPRVITDPVIDTTSIGLVLGMLAGLLFLLVAWRLLPQTRDSVRVALFFGYAWYAITIVPMVVTYFSARHLYFTSAGIVIALVAMGWILWQAGKGWPAWALRSGIVAAAVWLGMAWAAGLDEAFFYWNRAADVSHTIVRESGERLAAYPEGTLVLYGASPAGAFVWLQAWATPFSLQPPFQETDLDARVRIIEPLDTWCCFNSWLPRVQGAIRDWRADPARPPLVMLGWESWDGQSREVTAAQAPWLNQVVDRLERARSEGEAQAILDEAFRGARVWP